LGPIIIYLDRFLIGALISISAVAYYATPYEVVTKLWIIPVALTGVLFPAFSAGYPQDRMRTSSLFWKAVKYVFIVMFPIAILLDYTARELLLLWLGAGFAENSTLVLQIMVIGVLFNSVAQIPSALIQGTGRPDLKAKIHLLELPLFVGLLWWCVSRFGIEGAAVAFLVRIFVDAILFFEAGFHVVPETRPSSLVPVAALTPPILIVLAFPLVVQSTELRWLVMAIVVLTFAVAAWRKLLDNGERALFKGWLVAFKGRIIPRRS
jgi:O-antigen/teichoic acid export membrane protein